MHRNPPRVAPAERANAVADALAARLAKVAVGDPRSEATRMGPLVTRTQQAAALDGISKLASEAELICGGPTAPKLDGIDSTKSAFVAPTLLKVESADKARAVHDTEVFGPAATIIPYRSENEAFALIARGGALWLCRSLATTVSFWRAPSVSLDRPMAECSRSIPQSPMPTPGMASSCRSVITAGPAAPAMVPSWGPLWAAVLSSARCSAGFDRSPRRLAGQSRSTALTMRTLDAAFQAALAGHLRRYGALCGRMP